MKKRLLEIALSAMFLLAAAFALVSCDKGTATSIAIGTQPQTVYVEGNELNLSAGTLEVTTKKGTTEVALSQAEVTGYDKDTLGTQTLTVTYEDQTTTIDVTVKPRMVADANCVKSYLVGQELDRTAGSISITRDDGTSFSVALSSSAFQTFVYDFSKSGTAAVKTYYSEGGVDYLGSFSVTVYDVDKATVNKPNKTTYQSHETELDTTGSYLTLTANNEEATKYVKLSECTITGFDPSAATAENRTTPLEQTITVSYEGWEATFKIKITYSDVSAVKDAASALSTLDFSGETAPEVTKEQAEQAKEAVELYSALDADEKALITDDEIAAVVRSAAVYYQTAWTTSKTAYQDAITFSSGAVYPETGADYNTVETAVAALDKEEELYTLCDLLVSIRESFGDLVVYGASEEGKGTTVSSYLADVVSSSDVKSAAAWLEQTMAIYNDLNGVPTNWSYDWTDTQWNQYKAYTLSATEDLLSLNEEAEDVIGYYCQLLTVWREDAFDILYTYQYTAYKTEEGVSEESALSDLVNIYLPSQLEELYEYLYYAYAQGSSIYQESYYLYYYYYNSNGQNYFDAFDSAGLLTITDTTALLYYYNAAEELAAKIVAGDNAMLKYVYSNAASSMFGTLFSYARKYELNYTTTIYGDEECEAVLTAYFNVLDSVGAVTEEEFVEAVKGMAEKYFALSPTQQYAFLSALNPFYGTSYGGPSLAFDVSCYTRFTRYLYSAYSTAMNENSNAVSLFVGLMYASEYYARASYSKTYLTYFLSVMASVKTNYEALEIADQAIFKSAAGDIYQKYLDIYNLYDENGSLKETIDLSTVDEDTDWQAVFDELDEAIAEAYSAYSMYYTYSSYSLYVYGPYIFCYEWAQSLAAKIATAPEEVQSAYRTTYFSLAVSTSTTLTYTREYFVEYFLKSYYMNIARNNTIGNYMLLDWYDASVTDNLAAFMANVAKFISADDLSAYDADDVIALETAYRELSASELYLFTVIDRYSYGGTYYDWYWSTLSSYYQAVLGVKSESEGVTSYGATYDAAYALLAVERCYVYYVLSSEANKATQLETLNTYWAAFEEAYEAMTEEEQKVFDDLLSAKNAYYTEAVEAANTPAADTDSEVA
jgi:hypothetical protein